MNPSVEPVSFALVDGEVVVAVRSGSAGDAVTAGSPVAFEADVLDRRFHQGWTVVVRGVAPLAVSTDLPENVKQMAASGKPFEALYEITGQQGADLGAKVVEVRRRP